MRRVFTGTCRGWGFVAWRPLAWLPLARWRIVQMDTGVVRRGRSRSLEAAVYAALDTVDSLEDDRATRSSIGDGHVDGDEEHRQTRRTS